MWGIGELQNTGEWGLENGEWGITEYKRMENGK